MLMLYLYTCVCYSSFPTPLHFSWLKSPCSWPWTYQLWLPNPTNTPRYMLIWYWLFIYPIWKYQGIAFDPCIQYTLTLHRLRHLGNLKIIQKAKINALHIQVAKFRSICMKPVKDTDEDGICGQAHTVLGGCTYNWRMLISIVRVYRCLFSGIWDGYCVSNVSIVFACTLGDTWAMYDLPLTVDQFTSIR